VEENSSDVKECEVETSINTVPSSTTSPEVQIQNADVINISEDPIISKKNLDEESIKSGNKLILCCYNFMYNLLKVIVLLKSSFIK